MFQFQEKISQDVLYMTLDKNLEFVVELVTLKLKRPEKENTGVKRQQCQKCIYITGGIDH